MPQESLTKAPAMTLLGGGGSPVEEQILYNGVTRWSIVTVFCGVETFALGHGTCHRAWIRISTGAEGGTKWLSLFRGGWPEGAGRRVARDDGQLEQSWRHHLHSDHGPAAGGNSKLIKQRRLLGIFLKQRYLQPNKDLCLFKTLVASFVRQQQSIRLALELLLVFEK